MTAERLQEILGWPIAQNVRMEQWDPGVSGDYACCWRRAKDRDGDGPFARVTEMRPGLWRARTLDQSHIEDADGRARAVRKLLEKMLEVKGGQRAYREVGL